MKRHCLLLFFFITSFSISHLNAQPLYEFRGVWIATVDNIDWPSRGMTNVAAQKAEFIRQLDMHKKNGMNAIIMQIRPAADAFYSSELEPWSEWLTGKQGKAPSPWYDPLRFMIEEVHKRGMEFHAWLNPYRANFSIRKASIAPDHITKRKPKWFLTYGTTRYFDPSNLEAQEFVVKVVKDIVKRYDIDAIHMDDYFYPYRIAGKEFPDAAAYAKSGTNLTKGDWRRSNVDSIIVKLSQAIKKEKPYVKFGVSPFSVWRNKDQDPEGSDTHAGQTNYDDLYADVLLWLKKGWVDYVTPQLYLEIGHDKVDYEKMVDWWGKHSYGKHLYIGIAAYKAGANVKNVKWRDPEEIPEQIDIARANPNVHGAIYFSSTSFNKNPLGLNDSLQNNFYKTPALIPPMDWLPQRPAKLAAKK